MMMLNAFLLTYKSFISAADLMDLLITRYNLPKPKSTSADVRERFRSTREDPIHLRYRHSLVTHALTRTSHAQPKKKKKNTHTSL